MIVVMLDIARAFSMLANELDKQYAKFDTMTSPPTSKDWINALSATAKRIMKDERESGKPERHLNI